MNKSIYFALPILVMVAACGGGTTPDFDQQNVNFANQNQNGNNNGGFVDDVAVDTIVDLIDNSEGTSIVVMFIQLKRRLHYREQNLTPTIQPRLQFQKMHSGLLF